MILFENFQLALRSLRTNPLRSVLTLIGIAVGIGAVLYVVVLGEITQRSIKERLESLGSDILIIRPGFSRHRGVRTSASVVNLTWDDASQITAASNAIRETVPIFTGQGVVEFEDQNWNTRITGTTPAYVAVNNDEPIAGRFFNGDELDRRARVCILGATVHEELFGGRPPVDQAVSINSKRFTVIGLLGAKGESWSSSDDQVFMPLTTAQERLFGVDHLSSIYAQMRSNKGYDEALFDIETILRTNHRLRPDQENDFRVRRQDLYLSTIQAVSYTHLRAHET